MSIYLVSARASFVDFVNGAFAIEKPRVFSSSGQVLAELLGGSRSKWEVIVVDLASIDDARHLLDFVKSSGPLRAIRVLVAGTAEQLARMGEVPGGSADAMVQLPCTPPEMAAALTKVREQAGPPPGGMIPRPRAES